MLSRTNKFQDYLKNSTGLIALILIIFFVFFVLNIFYGPDKNLKSKTTELKKVKENELIVTLPRGVLTFYKTEKGRRLSSDEYKIVCNNTKIITQRAIMGANITDSKAFNLYTENGGTTGKYSVNWDETSNKCFAEFTIKPLEGTTNSVVVKGEALGFLKTSIDTRVYFIKNF